MAVQHESEFAGLAAGNVKSNDPGLNIPGLQTPPQPQAAVNPPVQPQVAPQPQPNFSQPTFNTNNGVEVGKGLLSGGTEWDIPFNLTSGTVEEFLLKFREVADKQPALASDKDSWDILLFDGASNQASISALVYCRRKGAVVAYYPLLVQASSEPLQDRNLGYTTFANGVQQSVTLPQLPEEIITNDKYLSDILPQFVLRAFAAKGVKDAIQVQGLVLPPELTPENVQQIARVLFYANAATESLLSDILGTTAPFNLATKAPDERLTLKFDFNAGQVATSTGLPVRSDVAIKLYVTKGDENKQGFLGQTKTRVFSHLHGYMALQYSPTQAPQFMPGMPYMMGPTPLFQPTFIINRMDNQFGCATLETQLMALATAGSIVRDNLWFKLYEPDYSLPGDGSDPRDIGNITLDANLPGEETGYTQTKNNPDPNFSVPAFLMKYLHQNVIFFIDVPELGDMTYLQRAFIDAAGLGSKGAEVAQRATAAIINAANVLTNGYFSQKWPGNEPIVYNNVGRIETGYYLNERGEYRDLAEIDYLRLIASGGGNLEHARAYMDSFNPGTGDEIMRFTARQRIYQTFYSGYQIRGYARRLTINSKFLMALAEALEMCAGKINIEAQNHQGVAVDRSYHNQVLGIPTNGVAGFSQNYWGGYQNNNQFNGTWGRWQAPTYAVYGGGVTY